MSHFVQSIIFYFLELVGKMSKKVWFIRKVHNNIQINNFFEKVQEKQQQNSKLKFDIWQIIIRNDSGIVAMTITKIPINQWLDYFSQFLIFKNGWMK